MLKSNVRKVLKQAEAKRDCVSQIRSELKVMPYTTDESRMMMFNSVRWMWRWYIIGKWAKDDLEQLVAVLETYVLLGVLNVV